MNIQDKLARLQEAAMTEARAEANAMVDQHKASLSSLLEERKAEVRTQSQTRIKTESLAVKQKMNMASNKALIERLREIRVTERKLKKQIFKEVQELLDAYMETEEYQALLVDYIRTAANFAEDEPKIIYINPTDADKKVYLEEQTGVELTVSAEDFIGGIRCVIRGKNILIDYAFKGALEREYKDYAFAGGAVHG